MYDLHHLKGNTYYIDGPTNCGVYKLNETDVVLIDCATSNEASLLDKVLEENNFIPRYIVMSHSHADHSGGSSYFQKKYHSILIASKIERAFFRDSKLDIGFLYGGYPLDEYDGKLMHISDNREIYALDRIPKGLQSFKLKGHHYGMIGIKTDDDVYFVADTLGSQELVDKQHILLIYDVAGYLESLNFVESLDGKMVVPSHSEATLNIKPVVMFNRAKIYEIIDVILDFLKKEHNCVDVAAYIFEYYNLKITYNKYMLILSTVRSYLSYLSNNKLIDNYFKNNRLYFKNNRK